MNFPQFTLGNKGCLENKHRWSSGFEWPPETSSNIADLCELSVIPMPPRWSKEHLCWIGSWHKSSKCPQISGCYPNTSVFVPPGFGFLVKAAPPPRVSICAMKMKVTTHDVWILSTTCCPGWVSKRLTKTWAGPRFSCLNLRVCPKPG